MNSFSYVLLWPHVLEAVGGGSSYRSHMCTHMSVCTCTHATTVRERVDRLELLMSERNAEVPSDPLPSLSASESHSHTTTPSRKIKIKNCESRQIYAYVVVCVWGGGGGIWNSCSPYQECRHYCGSFPNSYSMYLYLLSHDWKKPTVVLNYQRDDKFREWSFGYRHSSWNNLLFLALSLIAQTSSVNNTLTFWSQGIFRTIGTCMVIWVWNWRREWRFSYRHVTVDIWRHCARFINSVATAWHHKDGVAHFRSVLFVTSFVCERVGRVQDATTLCG